MTSAMNVPMWRATSKDSSSSGREANSVQWKSQGTIRRCPLEEMGRNSDRPWTIPRMMAWMTGMS